MENKIIMKNDRGMPRVINDIELLLQLKPYVNNTNYHLIETSKLKIWLELLKQEQRKAGWKAYAKM